MSVRQNMGYGLKIAGVPKAQINAKVEEAAKLLQLKPSPNREPRQCAAMGRATVRKPAVVLFDAPPSNLDAKLRVQMRLEIRELQDKLGITSLYGTHGRLETITMADRMIVMNGGLARRSLTVLQCSNVWARVCPITLRRPSSARAI